MNNRILKPKKELHKKILKGVKFYGEFEEDKCSKRRVVRNIDKK